LIFDSSTFLSFVDPKITLTQLKRVSTKCWKVCGILSYSEL